MTDCELNILRSSLLKFGCRLLIWQHPVILLDWLVAHPEFQNVLCWTEIHLNTENPLLCSYPYFWFVTQCIFCWNWPPKYECAIEAQGQPQCLGRPWHLNCLLLIPMYAKQIFPHTITSLKPGWIVDKRQTGSIPFMLFMQQKSSSTIQMSQQKLKLLRPDNIFSQSFIG